MPCAQGALGKLCMKEGSGEIDFSTGATGFPFFRESLQKRARIGHPDVIIGSREEVSERARFSPYFYGGWVVLALSPKTAATVFPWVLGADASGTTFALSETLQSMGVLADKVTGVHEFYNGYINRAIISAKQNGPDGPPNWVTCALQLLFMDYKDPSSAESYPSLTLGITGDYAPLIFEDSDNSGTSRLTLNAATREYKSFSLDINNHIQPRYVNALEPTALCPTRRTISLTTTHPYDSGTSNLYNQAVGGAAGSLVFVNGTVSITFTFACVQSDTLTPVINGKQEIDLQLTSSIRKLSTTGSLVCTIDDTV
jgi:hypothetical protein